METPLLFFSPLTSVLNLRQEILVTTAKFLHNALDLFPFHLIKLLILFSSIGKWGRQHCTFVRCELVLLNATTLLFIKMYALLNEFTYTESKLSGLQNRHFN